jgi:uncharacterized membrane protein
MRLARIIASRPRLVISVAMGVLAGFLLPPGEARLILGWDIGAGLLLIQNGIWMALTPPHHMSDRAKAQQDGEWTIFALVVAGVIASIFTIFLEFGALRDLHGAQWAFHLFILVATLIISWLTMQLAFGLRYAHEYYTMQCGKLQGGLDFPGESEPDYYDFIYFSLILGMTFQVSDVRITHRHLRRLAALQGFISFIFNMVILALTVNLAAGLI